MAQKVEQSALAQQLIARLRTIDTSVDPRTKGFDYAAHTEPLEEVLDDLYNALLDGAMTEGDADAVSKEAARIRHDLQAQMRKSR